MTVEFRLLGDVEVTIDGEPVDIGHLRQQCVLVALLVEANRPVPADRLVERVWGDRPPQRAAGTLRGYLSRLRTALAAASEVAIQRRPGGYVVSVDPLAVDLHRFTALVERARAATGGDAEKLLDQALGAWRGEAFATFDTPWLNAFRATLERQRHAADLDRNDLALAGGRHSSVACRLATSAARYPLDERLSGQLILALYRCGRQSDAIDAYLRLRMRLVEDMGADPGPPLQRLYRQMVAADPALTQPGPVVAGSAGPRERPPPRQLPACPDPFTGRARELGLLSEALDAVPGRAATVVISAVGGAGGVGKTWLALRWSHDNLRRFPDGQLYVNLRGFEPASDPVSPAAALRGFLDALGVPSADVPADLDAQAGLYRSLTAGRRMLILLDNARDTAQVGPLLPGTGPGTVLVTSRNQMTGLLAAHGARPLTLDVLTDVESRRLLADRLGGRRVRAEPAAVDCLVRLCGGLPLALGILAARAAVNPAVPLAGLADDVREASTRLDALDAGELPVNLRAVLSCSYGALPPAAARVFAQLGLADGPDISLPAAASLIAMPAGRVRAILRDLGAAHLVHEHVPGRYRMHDLTRLYAAEQVDEGERHPALRRLLDHYLHTATAAALRLYPYRDPIAVAAPAAGVVAEDIADHADALDWFTTERPVLLAAVTQAAATGFDPHAWQLAWTLTTFLDRQGHWHDWAQTQHTGLAAAARLGDGHGRAQAHRGLARAYTQLRRYDDALGHTQHALNLFAELGDHNGQAHTHLDLARVLAQLGRYRQALGHAQRTLDLYRIAGNRARQATALNTVGWYRAKLGDYQQALTHCRQALQLHKALGDRHGQAHTWDSLGYAHHHLHQYRQAVDCYRNAIDLIRHTGDQYHEADMLVRLGDSHAATGQLSRSRDAWRRSLAILDQLGHPDAGKVRTKLRACGVDSVRGISDDVA